MSYLDIAIALENKSLTLLVGTGFSMYMTDDSAPSWVSLLVECSHRLEDDLRTYNELFVIDTSTGRIRGKFELTICAQILEREFYRRGKNIREEIAIIIAEKVNRSTINTDHLLFIREFFSQNSSINVVTTNYDTLFSDYILPENNRIFAEGVPVGRDNSGLNIYHVHGSIINPASIVLTMDDYFRFQYRDSYFSRKLYTLLQETTVVILGYSLGDFNLNQILNEAKNTKVKGRKKNDIYYLTRDEIDHTIQSYYLDTYGIEVIRESDLTRFFYEISENIDTAKKVVEAQRNIKTAILNNEVGKEDLRSRQSFDNIINCLVNMGMHLSSPRSLDFLRLVFSQKWELTQERNAWDQYVHFANWLIDLASEIPLRTTSFKDEFLRCVYNSFRKMSRELYLGYSWQAFTAWDSRWSEMLFDNRELIIELIDNEYFERINCVGDLRIRHDQSKNNIVYAF